MTLADHLLDSLSRGLAVERELCAVISSPVGVSLRIGVMSQDRFRPSRDIGVRGPKRPPLTQGGHSKRPLLIR